MQRQSAASRVKELVNVATRTFITNGYRRTRMEDLTAIMELSQGAIYRYVESKEALFDLLVRVHSSPELDWEQVQIPVPSPAPGATLAFLRKVLLRHGEL